MKQSFESIIAAQSINSMPAMLTSHINASSRLSYPLSIKVPDNASEKAAAVDPSAWVPVLCAGELSGVPGFSL